MNYYEPINLSKMFLFNNFFLLINIYFYHHINYCTIFFITHTEFKVTVHSMQNATYYGL